MATHGMLSCLLAAAFVAASLAGPLPIREEDEASSLACLDCVSQAVPEEDSETLGRSDDVQLLVSGDVAIGVPFNNDTTSTEQSNVDGNTTTTGAALNGQKYIEEDAEDLMLRVNARNGTLVLDLDGTWCSHSAAFLPTLSEVADRLRHRDDVTVAHCSVNKNRALRERLNVTTYPTLLIFPRGEKDPVKFTGKRSRANVLAWVEYYAPYADAVQPAARIPPMPAVDASVQEAAVPAAEIPVEELLEVEAGVGRKIWNASLNSTVFQGAADNSLDHSEEFAAAGEGDFDVAVVKGMADAAKLFDQNCAVDGGKPTYVAAYIFNSSCEHCSCLDDVWKGVRQNLVVEGVQGDLCVVGINGKTSQGFVEEAEVQEYPSFVLMARDGPAAEANIFATFPATQRRKVHNLCSWVQDSIVARENPSHYAEYGSRESQGNETRGYEHVLVQRDGSEDGGHTLEREGSVRIVM